MTNLEFYKEKINRYYQKYNLQFAVTRVRDEYDDRRFDCDDLVWLCKEYRPKILTDKEHRYLSLVIEPFRDKVVHIGKLSNLSNEFIFIHVRLENGNLDVIYLPRFKENTQYIGMKENHYYTPEELNL